MIDQAPLWADPRLTYTVAALAVLLLLAAVWLFGRRKRQGRQAGVICLTLSIALHLALIILVPKLPMFRGQATLPNDSATSTAESIASFQFFDPDAGVSSDSEEIDTPISPLPISNLTDPLDPPQTQTIPAENTIAEDSDTSADAMQPSATAESAPNSKTNSTPAAWNPCNRIIDPRTVNDGIYPSINGYKLRGSKRCFQHDFTTGVFTGVRFL